MSNFNQSDRIKIHDLLERKSITFRNQGLNLGIAVVDTNNVCYIMVKNHDDIADTLATYVYIKIGEASRVSLMNHRRTCSCSDDISPESRKLQVFYSNNHRREYCVFSISDVHNFINGGVDDNDELGALGHMMSTMAFGNRATEHENDDRGNPGVVRSLFGDD